MNKLQWIAVGMMLSLMMLICMSMMRYPVGEAVPAEVYTARFNSQDGIYKFFKTDYGEPNKPRLQAAPDDWVQNFGNNERTLLFHAVSELRVIQADLNRRLLELEAEDPNET